MNNILFLDKPSDFTAPNNSFKATLSNSIKNEDELFQDLADKLKFPKHFGFNWNAVWDYLMDFHWVDQQNIIIVHKTLPRIDNNILKLYINLLIEASNKWENFHEHKLTLIFSKLDESIVESLMDKNNY